MDDRTRAYYERGVEIGRLFGPDGEQRLELARTVELLERFLPPAPADVVDVGGGPGVYAALLAERGYRVRLVDVLPFHVEHAREDGRFEAVVGDARALDVGDCTQDAVLLMGPLYHLTVREDRVRALAEARRVLRPGGVVAAVAISRFASLFDGLRYHRFGDPEFVAIAARDLHDGQHRNESERTDWFATAFFHHPDDLEAEVREAGFELDGILGVEGPASWFETSREIALWAARATESDVASRAVSPHLLAIGRRP